MIRHPLTLRRPASNIRCLTLDDLKCGYFHFLGRSTFDQIRLDDSQIRLDEYWMHTFYVSVCRGLMHGWIERWGAGVETQKNVRGEIK